MLDNPIAEIEREAYLRGDLKTAELAARLLEVGEPDDVDDAVDRATSDLEDEVYELEVEVGDLREERDELLTALKACVESMAGYRREHNESQPCDAERAAAELIEKLEAKDG